MSTTKNMPDNELITHIQCHVEVSECDYNTGVPVVMTEQTIQNQTRLLTDLIVLLRKKAIIIDDEIEELLTGVFN